MEVGERRRTSQMVYSDCFQEVGSEKEKGLAFRGHNCITYLYSQKQST